MTTDLSSTQAMYANLIHDPVRRQQTHRHTGFGEGSVSFHEVLRLMLVSLGFTTDPTAVLEHNIFWAIHENANEAHAARAVHKVISNWDREHVAKQLEARAQNIADVVRPYCDLNTLFDFGCGDGMVTHELMASADDEQFTHTPILYDVSDYRDQRVRDPEKFMFISNRVNPRPFACKNSTTMCNLVLHHCDDPEEELAFLREVSDRVIVIESIISPYMPLHVQAFCDWFYNRCLRPEANIPVPGNWKTAFEWELAFLEAGFTLKHQSDLGFDEGLVPEHHWLFVLE